MYLSGAVHPLALTHAHMGVIITPDMGNMPDLSRTSWAADNGCFAQGAAFKTWRYVQFLEERMAASRATCLFATAPDVVCDHEATWRRSAPVLPLLRGLGYRAAFVAQNGIRADRLDWDAFDALFLGGDTQWKLSQATRHLVSEAKRRGKWVHMGRVNSYMRLERAALWGCDSADGTYVKYGPDKNARRVAHWLETINRQPQLLSA